MVPRGATSGLRCATLRDRAASSLRDADRPLRRRLFDLRRAATRDGPRFAVVYHLLSLAHNWRLRVRAFAPDDDFPVVASVIDVWPAANWFEREAFDLFGIMFTGPSGPAAHPDRLRLRRASVPQGLPAVRPCRDALRPRAGARHLPAGDDRAARDRAADHPRGRTTGGQVGRDGRNPLRHGWREPPVT